MARVKTGFPKSIPALIGFARFVNSSIRGNPNFATISAAFSAALAQLEEDIEILQKAQDDTAFGGTNKTSFRDQAATKLCGTLRKVAMHVQLQANGDIAVLKSSGFEVFDPLAKKWKIPDVLPQLMVSLAPGDKPGTYIARAQPIPYALGFEAYVSQGDPTIPENWNLFNFYEKPIMHMVGFTTGEDYNVRFRLVCSKGKGPWSPIHTFTSH